MQWEGDVSDMNNLVKIKKFNVIGQDDRGMTANFNIPRQQNEFLFLTRKSESLSGNIYHEGKNVRTNPKTFVLLKGSIKLSYRKIGDKTVNTVMINNPAVIEIFPMVTHKVEAISDIIILECNSINDIQSDRKKEKV